MEPIALTYDICRRYLQDQTEVDPALIAKVGGLHRSRNLAGLASCTCYFDWASHTINDWRFLRQVEAFFKKNSALSNPETCRQAAEASFLSAEDSCRKTNLRLQQYVGYLGRLEPDIQHYILAMRRYISNVLGDYHSFIEQLPSLVKVTSGATADSNRRNSLPQLKMRHKSIYATRNAAKYLRAVLAHYGCKNPKIKVTHTNRVELVPKNWKTDRTIACEPEGNLPLQLAFDTYAKRRLRIFGIDLSKQSANQSAAKAASIHNDLVTVDFSAASDTISYNAVSLLFPEEWFAYLSDVRTPCRRGCFGEGVYSKFSSMGNGSTFTIETLIFAAACHAVGSRSFLVYGDDVIIETEYYQQFLDVTRFLGFSINEEKSFADGPFRESCGGDYYNGINVTPVYIRDVDSRKATLCHLVNTLASIAFPEGHLEALLLSLVKGQNLPLVPYNESTLSGVWIDPRRAFIQGILRKLPGNGRYKFKSYCPKTRRWQFIFCRGAYYLWFLNKTGQVVFAKPWVVKSATQHLYEKPTETSWAALFEHSYVRKWVEWQPSLDGVPAHLEWWTERLIRA